MLTVEYTMREFLNSVTIVKWEWILSTIIFIASIVNRSSLGSSEVVIRILSRKSKFEHLHMNGGCPYPEP